MGFIDEQRQKYKVLTGKISFLNYIFFRTIMIIAGAFSYKIAAFTRVYPSFPGISKKTNYLPDFSQIRKQFSIR